MACCLVAKSYLTLCDGMKCSPPGSSVHGISQAKTLEGVAISFFGGSSQPRNRILVSSVGRCVHYRWATREAQYVVPSPFRSCYLHSGTHALYLNLTSCFFDVGHPWGKFIALFDLSYFLKSLFVKQICHQAERQDRIRWYNFQCNFEIFSQGI